MAKLVTTLIYDPILFKGGSKVATSDALHLCSPDSHQFIIITADKHYWHSTEFYRKHQPIVCSMPLSKWLSAHHNGLLYWLEQFFAAFILLMFVTRFHQITRLIGASGPGIDMALYIVQKLTAKEVIQWVHGNVGCSRSIGYCFVNASAVFYLPSTKKSIKKAIEHYLQHRLQSDDVESISTLVINHANYYETVNGITQNRWPSQAQRVYPIGFWAASLLKWKGLDTLIEGLKLADRIKPLSFNICYIKPLSSQLPVSSAPVNLVRTQWYQEPDNLDEIRRQSNIFVSTSRNEPFGLSILEALAAGMCVLLPSDNAYWDKQLTHNVNCIKYQPDDPDSLCHALLYAFSDFDIMERCCNGALDIASQYKAEQRYLSFVRYMDNNQHQVAPNVQGAIHGE